ncbi:type II toxin-antitoxin system RelB family antitoxin [Devosia sp.]|uniref:type II toxin-antitoxin system RelB family antitoxin n=1 Tax=Devosia sp. TaxID=1871048 RepID=UPI003BAA18A5
MLTVRLPPEIEARLDAIAKQTCRTKSAFAREAILEKLEDMEDYAIAVERLQTMGKRIDWEDVKAELDRLDESDRAAG